MEGNGTDALGIAAAVLALIAAVGSFGAWRAAKRAERRQLDRNDVSWNIKRDGEWWLLVNEGQDPALNLSGRVWVDEDEVSVAAEHFDPGTDMPLDLPAATRTRAATPMESALGTPGGYELVWQTPNGRWASERQAIPYL